jgi:hypothetical protein
MDIRTTKVFCIESYILLYHFSTEIFVKKYQYKAPDPAAVVKYVKL